VTKSFLSNIEARELNKFAVLELVPINIVVIKRLFVKLVKNLLERMDLDNIKNIALLLAFKGNLVKLVEK